MLATFPGLAYAAWHTSVFVVHAHSALCFSHTARLSILLHRSSASYLGEMSEHKRTKTEE